MGCDFSCCFAVVLSATLSATAWSVIMAAVTRWWAKTRAKKAGQRTGAAGRTQLVTDVGGEEVIGIDGSFEVTVLAMCSAIV